MPVGRQERGRAILAVFKPFFEDAGIAKVWHNYSFDRHVLQNMHITAAGFAGDTMHMARLWDSSRKGKGYSLESLSRCATRCISPNLPCPGLRM